MDKPAYDKPLVSLDVDMWIYHVLAKKNGTKAGFTTINWGAMTQRNGAKGDRKNFS